MLKKKTQLGTTLAGILLILVAIAVVGYLVFAFFG
jgi:hypothetical protein